VLVQGTDYGLAGGELLLLFDIQVRQSSSPSPFRVRKTWDSVLALARALEDKFGEEAVPSFPKRTPRDISAQVDFLQELRLGVQSWLDALLALPAFQAADEMETFLSHSDAVALRSDSEEEKKLKVTLEGSDLGVVEPQGVRRSIGLDDFVSIRVLGRGSFGKVVLVKKKDTETLYAMKILKKSHILKRNQVEHTKTERNVLEYIQHPFIVALRFAFQTKTKLYLVLDYYSGGELFFYLGKEGKFSESRAKFYAAQIVLALQYLHELGIVYRDLKPENVILDHYGNIALTDFGLSKEGISDNTSATSFCGTPEYLAPEILRRVGHGKAADWWSLGALIYEMLTGIPPFYSRDRERLFQKILNAGLRLPPHLSDEAKSLLRALLNRDPTMRIGSVKGAIEVRSHKWFADIDWEKLLAKKVDPPFKPPPALDNEYPDHPMGGYLDEDSMDPHEAEVLKAFADVKFTGFSYQGTHGADSKEIL